MTKPWKKHGWPRHGKKGRKSYQVGVYDHDGRCRSGRASPAGHRPAFATGRLRSAMAVFPYRLVRQSAVAAGGERAVAAAALEVSRAALSEQHAAVRDLRAHTGALLTATSVVVSFLGSQALRTRHLRVLAFLGLGVFVGSLVLSLAILLPTERISSLRRGSDLLSVELDESDPASDAYGRLAGTYDQLIETNKPYIERLGRMFTLASGSILLEVVLWALQLAIS
jgi:hypothetical protein